MTCSRHSSKAGGFKPPAVRTVTSWPAGAATGAFWPLLQEQA